MRQCVTGLFSAQPPLKQAVIDEIIHDEDILFNWAIAAELLTHVVQVWVTIRGFSVAGAWTEYYKQCSKQYGRGNIHIERRSKLCTLATEQLA